MSTTDPSSHLVTQFSEDAYAQVARLCQRPSCTVVINPGEPCHYVAPVDQTKPGSRTQASLPSPQAIRQSVGAAQSRASINPPPVMAMANLHMPPPPVPIQLPSISHTLHPQLPIQGPNIHMPSAMAPAGAGASLPAGSVGYTPRHLQYAVQREHWQCVAHHPPPAETISLEVSALYESGVRKKGLQGNPIGNICEGLKDINALASAAELVDIALRTITPRIQAFRPEFLWQDSEFVCLHPATHKNSRAMVFKAKQFSLYIVVPASQWQELEAFREKLDDTTAAGTSMFPVTSVTNAATTPKGSEAPAVSASRTLTTTLFDRPISHDIRHLFDQTELSTSLMMEAGTSMLAKRHHRQSSSISSTMGLSPPHKKSVTSILDLDNLESSSDISSTAGLTVPWHKKPLAMSLPDPESNSISSATGFTLPRNKPATASLPDPDRLKTALQSGGRGKFELQTILKQKFEPINFYLIPTRDITELVRGNDTFDINKINSLSGTILVTHSSHDIIGVGAFKTAQRARINIFGSAANSLGSTPNEEIILKRPYDVVQGSPPYTRLTLHEESIKLVREANILYWSKALLNMTYNYIHHCVSKSTDPPPFEIPILRFVVAGLVVVYSHRPGGPTGPHAPKPGSASAMYLAEELIRFDDGPDGISGGGLKKFTKFIHNSNPNPFPEPGEYGYETAEFLAFTQHVQYSNTNGQVYISDYQGSMTLLSDPQILTHPDVNQGQILFGEGNLEDEVAAFEHQHICNKYCKWPGFQLEVFGKGKARSSGTASCKGKTHNTGGVF
ncbi:hypothetical protein BKA82DRAFT_4351868 [Pisolithus tinctorius]|nr:hypothetical protein BKA82DRAFT_4351868 [Pisolithus tinctorius]